MRRLLALVVAAGLALGASGCAGSDADGTTRSTTTKAPATTTTSAVPEPLDDQTAPPSINGLTVQGPTLWIASIKGDQLLQVDRRTGAILARIPTNGDGPDDVAIGPDGDVWSTGFVSGNLGRVHDGRYEVVTQVAPSINPLEFDADGTLYVGTYGPKGVLYRVPTEGDHTPVVVARDLPDINAFSVVDGAVIAPVGGVAGPGGAVRIDPRTGTIDELAGDLPATAAGAADAKGRPYVLANITGDVFRIDPKARTATKVRTVPKGAPFDNLAFAPDGTLYLSSFTAPSVTVVTPDGTVSQLRIGR